MMGCMYVLYVLECCCSLHTIHTIHTICTLPPISSKHTLTPPTHTPHSVHRYGGESKGDGQQSKLVKDIMSRQAEQNAAQTGGVGGRSGGGSPADEAKGSPSAEQVCIGGIVCVVCIGGRVYIVCIWGECVVYAACI